MDLPADTRAYRASLFHLIDDPGLDGQPLPGTYEWYEDGLLLVADGRILALGSADKWLPRLPDGLPVTHWPDSLIVPGFIDAHIHFPQIDIIASYGEQLLEWLNNYTFPAEQRFADADYAAVAAEVFLDELFRCGTTCALVFCTVHPCSVDALFSAAARRRLRLIAGKVLMDRHAPKALRDTPETGDRDSRALIERWHGHGRLEYAVTPRFAATSTPEQLHLAGRLLVDYPGLPMQTHLAESLAEVDWTRRLFPERHDYLDVYEHYGLLRERSVFAHCIHIDDDARRRIANAGASTAFCPTSNTFLGSGLFDLHAAKQAGVAVSLATDVGAGTTCSMLQTMAEAYKVTQLRGQSLNPLQAFYLATLGNARALGLDSYIGNLQPGREADFVVLDRRATPLLARKDERATSLQDILFNLIILGDDRAVRATHIAGRCLYERPGTSRPE